MVEKASPPNTVWRRTAGEKPSFDRPPAKLEAEVAIVGGGFTGLSTALHLARRNVEVVLLESQELAWGASGRNAGFVVPNFSKADPASVIARLGKEKGRHLLDCVGRGGEQVFRLAAEAGLGRQAEQNGWLQPAHSAAMADVLRQRVLDWQSIRLGVEWIDAAETAVRTGMEIYHGALADTSGGMINPVAYAYALARLAAAAGAQIYEHEAVKEIKETANGWLLTSSTSQIRAKKVLLSTNAYREGVAARLASQIIPLQVYQIATEPLDHAVYSRFSPRREPVSDTRSNIFTFRLDTDNRLLSGGMAIFPWGAEARMGRYIVRRLASELSLPNVPRVEDVWHGTAAVTTDFLPHIYRLGDDFLAATGCNGRGVAMTTMLGDVLADAFCGAALTDLPVPVSEPTPIPMRTVARAAPSAYLVQGMWNDWLSTRKIKRHN